MLYASFELSKAALKERALREQLARAAWVYYTKCDLQDGIHVLLCSTAHARHSDLLCLLYL